MKIRIIERTIDSITYFFAFLMGIWDEYKSRKLDGDPSDEEEPRE